MNVNRWTALGLSRCDAIGVVAAVALLTLAAGCAAPIRVRSVYGPGIRLDGLGSQYDWVPDSASRPENAQFDQFIREAFDQQLAAKGFIQAQDPPHDFDLDYRVGRAIKGDLLYDRTYEEGSLIIDALDPQNGRVIWRGIAETMIRDSDAPEARQRRIRQAAHQLMEKFPPRLGPSVSDKP